MTDKPELTERELLTNLLDVLDRLSGGTHLDLTDSPKSYISNVKRLCAEARDELRALSGGVGYVMVPVEPTEEMSIAGTLYDSSDTYSDIGADVAGIYKAMLAAAPAGAKEGA